MTRRKFYFTLLFASGALIGIIMGYSALVSSEVTDDVIGQALVETEVPPPDFFPLFTKPVTIMMMLLIIFWYALIGLIRDKVNSFGHTARMSIRLVLIIASIVSFYEVLFNFMLWSSLLTMEIIQGDMPFNPDTAVNVFPTDRYPINMVFATKIAVTVFGCSIYALVSLWGGKKDEGS